MSHPKIFHCYFGIEEKIFIVTLNEDKLRNVNKTLKSLAKKK